MNNQINYVIQTQCITVVFVALIEHTCFMCVLHYIENIKVSYKKVLKISNAEENENMLTEV